VITNDAWTKKTDNKPRKERSSGSACPRTMCFLLFSPKSLHIFILSPKQETSGFFLRMMKEKINKKAKKTF